MNRVAFEHVIRAATAIVDDELVVIGTQAIHAEVAAPPPELLLSRELAVYPRGAPERAVEIDAAIGDGSQFDATYGYYAHGVGPETAVAPAGWTERLVRVELPANRLQPAAVAWCMSVHDLVLAKLAAGRSHDLEFAEQAVKSGLVDQDQLLLGAELMPESHKRRTEERLRAILERVR